MSREFKGFGMNEEEFTEMIRGIIVEELKIVFEKMQEVKPKQSAKKDMLTRQEVINEYEIGSTTLYKLKKENKLVPKKLAGGRKHYYFRKDLDKHFS